MAVQRFHSGKRMSDAVTCNDMRRLAYGDDFSHFPRGARVSWIAIETP